MKEHHNVTYATAIVSQEVAQLAMAFFATV
jgi:hypothetical protein